MSLFGLQTRRLLNINFAQLGSEDMNQIFRNITIQNYLELKNSFEGSKEIFWNEDNNSLVHPGEYGVYREELLSRFLRLYLPKEFGISSGFLITSKGQIRHQCDIIIYAKEKTPQIQNMENQRFFPIETVLGVGEVKSTINSIGELNGHLIKISNLKKLRDDVDNPTPFRRDRYKTSFDPDLIFSDNILTFLLCYKFGFNLDAGNIDYNGIDYKLWHNMVFSLKDGLLSYQHNNTYV
jgi:hypothetical protein